MMKGKTFRRLLSAALTLCMVLALLPTSAFAETVTTTPGNTSLDVEYFTSTLYNWDEDAANKATAEADVADDSEVSYSAVSLSYNRDTDCSGYANNGYYYLTDGNYYLVTSLSATNNKGTTTWTIGFNSTSTTTTGNLTLYTMSTSYEGKGFYFTNGSNKQSIPTFSKWLDSKQNYMIYSGLAASKLSESSNVPFNDETVNAANLFATDGSNGDYADVYTNVGVPFVYDSTTGYYTLNSDLYAVYFDGGSSSAKSNTNLTIADKPAAHSYTEISGYYYATGFLPFDDVSTTTQTAVKSGGSSAGSTTGYQTSSTTWGFGMVTTVDFQMTDDGKDAKGNAIEFTFSGDDDVWVYIDGVLVLDIGGTHDAITGTIDFSTGEVELTAGSYGQIGDLSGKTSTSSVTTSETLSQTNVYTALGTTLTGFTSQGSHTMTIYYMERGQGRSNCLIQFNLPQKDSVSVTKEISDTYTTGGTISDSVMTTLNNLDFTFTLYNGSDVVANTNYSLYDSTGTLVGSGSTDANGTFTLKNGQTATFKNISLDEESSYYVVETSPGSRWTAEWTATSSVSNASYTDNESAENTTASQTVTVTGSSSATDTISFVCTNSYAVGEDDPDVDANGETIVLDYGLPVEVDVMANDSVTVEGEVYTDGVTLSLTDAVDGTYTGTYGYATINSDGNIVYTLTKDFCGIETVNYTITAVYSGKTHYGYATLTIIPATSVYYEEDFSVDYDGPAVAVADWNAASNFITIATNNASFTEVGSDIGGYQETGFVGTTDDSTYGTDAVYLNNLEDSYGTSLKVDTTESSAQYKYTFTGMGTAIYGRVSSDTAYIKVSIYAIGEDGEEITDTKDSAGHTVDNSVDTQLIDTINLYEEGNELDENLYNIPIYQNSDLEYGTYVVRIYVYKEGTPTGTRDSSGSEFYLDGIRVFDPMGTSTDDNADYTTAASAYASDGEANTAVVNIRAKIVADAENGYSNSIFTLTDINGEIVNVSADTTSEEDDDSVYYTDIGPNEEFYLKEGYYVSFALVNWDSQKYTLYLGLKAPNGIAASVTFTDAIGGDEVGSIAVNNSADCYYDISNYVVVEDGIGYVYIEGTSELTALTNIKVTGVDKFNLAYDTDIDATSLTTLYMVSTAYAASLSEESQEEVEVFTPEYIKNTCSYASKTKKVTVTVLTSTDVSYVTINGEQISAKTVSGKYRFTKSYTKVEAGTTYEIICYNADGVASETYTVTAK